MRKPILLVALAALVWAACGGESQPQSLAEKRIKQDLDVVLMTIKYEIETLERMNDTTYRVVYSYYNEIVDKDVRITDDYYFTSDLDSIIGDINIKGEIKSEGEWVEVKN